MFGMFAINRKIESSLLIIFVAYQAKKHVSANGMKAVSFVIHFSNIFVVFVCGDKPRGVQLSLYT